MFNIHQKRRNNLSINRSIERTFCTTSMSLLLHTTKSKERPNRVLMSKRFLSFQYSSRRPCLGPIRLFGGHLTSCIGHGRAPRPQWLFNVQPALDQQDSLIIVSGNLSLNNLFTWTPCVKFKISAHLHQVFGGMKNLICKTDRQTSDFPSRF